MTNSEATKINNFSNSNVLARSVATCLANGINVKQMAALLTRRTGLQLQYSMMVVEIHADAEYARQDAEPMMHFTLLPA